MSEAREGDGLVYFSIVLCRRGLEAFFSLIRCCASAERLRRLRFLGSERERRWISREARRDDGKRCTLAARQYGRCQLEVLGRREVAGYVLRNSNGVWEREKNDLGRGIGGQY